MKTFGFLASVLIISGCIFSIHPVMGADKLMAGTAKINITPPKTKYPVHDSLYARTLILDAGSSRIAFVALDLGGYSNISLLEKLKSRFNLQEAYFCPQHTHSSETALMNGWKSRFCLQWKRLPKICLRPVSREVTVIFPN
ncbi:hypothetical protein EZS27_011907 [termite gut metagenome]|uniref:Uncharacterized protein n=1 Tax=termite gut metagenome TaxID=433724 RepID=A0A5J4S2B5_9ZZZZ